MIYHHMFRSGRVPMVPLSQMGNVASLESNFSHIQLFDFPVQVLNSIQLYKEISSNHEIRPSVLCGVGVGKFLNTGQ